MSFVSCRATRILLEAAELRGVNVRALVVGTPVTLEHLRDVRARIPWNLYAEIIDRLEHEAGGVIELERLGTEMTRTPSYGFFANAARYVVTTRHLHELGRRFVAPALFPDLPFDFVESTDQRIIIRSRLPASWRSCAGFFHICRGSLSMLSTMLGLPPSVVDATIGPRGATLEVLLPRDERRGRNLFRRIRARIAGVPINELLEQQDAVNESYERLLRTRQEFRDLLERIPIGAAIHRGGRYVWVNSALAEMLGFERPADVVGRNLLDDVHPEDRPTAAARLASPAEEQTGKLRVLRRDGATVIYHVTATQDVVFEGDRARLIVGNDITERARVREQLALADRMAAVGMLAAGVAHEINNPLTYVQLNVESIARGLERAAAFPKLQSAASTAVEGMERVRAIVADLRTFARVDEDAAGPVDLNDVVSTTLRLATNTLAAGATLEVDLGGIPAVHGNRGRLGQVVLNLLLNAHEACEERGGNGVIRIRTARAEDGRVLLELADSGVGIPKESVGRVFEPFYTTKGSGRGTGLGLSICHRIVDRFGGEIAIESDPTRPGARELRTFIRIRLPCANANAAAPARLPTPRKSTPSRQRILVIDDESSVGDAIASVLGADHDIEVVTDGDAALARLDSDAFDLVLCDVMMPGTDGIAVYERVRETSPSLAKRFVFMSGGAFTPRARTFLASCENPRFEKPFNAEQLLALTAR